MTRTSNYVLKAPGYNGNGKDWALIRMSQPVNPSSTPGCTQTNNTDVQIPDLSTVESTVTVSGCSDNASAASTVRPASVGSLDPH